MHKRRFFFLMFLVMLLPLAALAEGLSLTVMPDTVRPGKTERISFEAPAAGTARLEVLDGSGAVRAVIRESLSAAEGVNHLTWDGTDGAGAALPPGEYILSLSLGGETAQRSFLVGEESPQILSVAAQDMLEDSKAWFLTVRVNLPGVLTAQIKTADNAWHTLLQESVPAGESALSWDGTLDGQSVPGGVYAVQLKLTDSAGYSGTVKQILLTVAEKAEPTPVPTAAPSPTPHAVIPSAVTTPEDETCFWTLPVGDMDEAAIWEVMMQPIVVIDSSKISGKTQKDVYQLRKTPDNSARKENIVGEITYDSQGLHILETRDDGWTLVEAYNSSYGPNCASRPGYGVTDDLIQGYVKTALLKTVNPRTDYALLIDKLEQTMYIFSEGKCIGSLLVSTGLNNAKQAWNETPSGEFLMISRMGDFAAGNLWCKYGMRVNGGCAIHEVPYIGDADTPSDRRDYSSTVKLLGKKASHGCIRVQKAANAQGQNIKWLWDNIRVNTKVLIWDDTGRLLSYPDDDLPLYYNPNGGKYFHEDQYCSSVKSRYLPLTEFSYGELDSGDFLKLEPCATCTRIMRKTEIDALNRENGF